MRERRGIHRDRGKRKNRPYRIRKVNNDGNISYGIMLFPVCKEDAACFFNLINTLHEKASLIITTNKTPTEWTKDPR